METLFALAYWPLVGVLAAVGAARLLHRGIGRRWIMYGFMPVTFVSAGAALGVMVLRLHLHGPVLRAVVGQSESAWGLMLFQLLTFGSVVLGISPLIARLYADKRAAELAAAESDSRPSESSAAESGPAHSRTSDNQPQEGLRG